MKKNLFLVSLLLLVFAGCSHLTNVEKKQLKSNKDIVVKFYEEALFKGNITAAKKYISEDYIQHNPHVPDGKEALINVLTKFAPKDGKIPGEIVRVIAEGDLVVLHVKFYSWPSKNGGAVIDIFRVKNGKITEHWDVIQAIPEKTANNNTMF